MTTVDPVLIPVAAAPAGRPYAHISVDRVAGACGAVVSGVDLAAGLTDVEVAEVRRALLDHQVVFFRDQRLDPDQLVAFSHRFGPPSPVPFVQPIREHPEVIAVVREASETHGYTFGGLWHSDFSFLPAPPFARRSCTRSRCLPTAATRSSPVRRSRTPRCRWGCSRCSTASPACTAR